jgi:hypothetical protein
MSETAGAGNTAGKQRGKPFRKGQSGNPDGRPKGARNATTIAVETLLDGEAETLTRKAIEMAKGSATEADIRSILPMLESFQLPQVSNRQVWVFAATIDGASAEEIAERLAPRTFTFQVVEDDERCARGAVLLEASNENRKLFVVPTAGILGWAFSGDEMATLKAGRTYQTRMQSKIGDRTKRMDVSPLVVRGF